MSLSAVLSANTANTLQSYQLLSLTIIDAHSKLFLSLIFTSSGFCLKRLPKSSLHFPEIRTMLGRNVTLLGYLYSEA